MIPELSDPRFFFLYLLVLGHVIGDSLLQTDALIRGKRGPSRWPLFRHALLVAAATLAVLLPFYRGWPLPAVAVLLGATHFLIDGLKIRCEGRPFFIRGDLLLNSADQLLHLAAILAAWRLLPDGSFRPARVLPGAGWFLFPLLGAGVFMLGKVVYLYARGGYRPGEGAEQPPAPDPRP